MNQKALSLCLDINRGLRTVLLSGAPRFVILQHSHHPFHCTWILLKVNIGRVVAELQLQLLPTCCNPSRAITQHSIRRGFLCTHNISSLLCSIQPYQTLASIPDKCHFFHKKFFLHKSSQERTCFPPTDMCTSSTNDLTLICPVQYQIAPHGKIISPCTFIAAAQDNDQVCRCSRSLCDTMPMVESPSNTSSHKLG